MRAVRRVNDELYLDPQAPEPTPSAGQALIKPTRVLIGEADVGVAQGRIDHTGVLGHQFVGVVDACDDTAWVGKRVVGNIHISDPSSELARRGLGNHDPDRLVLGLRGRDGCLAESFVLETRNLCEVPETIDDEHACLAFMLARAMHAGQVAHIEGRPFVSVLGEGLTGLLCAQVMTRLNASVRLLSSQSDRLELCAKWGIKHRHINEVGRRHDQDVIIETTGTAEGLDDALRMVRPLGTIVLTGAPVPLNVPKLPIDHGLIADKEIRIIGSRCGSISEGVRAMSSGEIDLSGLITKRYKLDDAISALRSAQDESNIGVLVSFD
ncbi:MAG: zinc-binding dehydrogenase [Phycisphaerales bacterium JB047]